MQIYILRHGRAHSAPPAEPSGADPSLSEEGLKGMEASAREMATLVPGFDIILTSPRKRADETARIVARLLNCTEAVIISPALSPGATPEDLLKEIARYSEMERLLLVGHEPDLGRLASALLGEGGARVEFQRGALARIDVDDAAQPGTGRLLWYLTPEDLLRAGRPRPSNSGKSQE
jgi:phosphohistidine phosphatase